MIKVQIEELSNDLQKLNGAISNFEPYSNKFIQNTVESLGGQNSDFISKIKDTLENMTDTKAPELLTKLKEFYQDGLVLVDVFREADAKLAESEKLNK